MGLKKRMGGRKENGSCVRGEHTVGEETRWGEGRRTGY